MGFEDIIIIPSERDLQQLDSNVQKKLISVDNKNGLNIDNFLNLANEKCFSSQGFIHEILEKSEILFVQTPKETRDPELDARITKLKAEQANKEYKKMVKSLIPQNESIISFREDVKSVTSQLTAVINFVLSIGGSFFFAYKAVEYALPEQNIPAQVMMGVITSTVVAIADLFFLARTI